VDVMISGGDELGTYTTGSRTYQFWLVDGVLKTRRGTAAWGSGPTYTYLNLAPLLGLTDEKQLKTLEATHKNGLAVYHLQASAYLSPSEMFKVAVMPTTALDRFSIIGGAFTPSLSSLDLYVTSAGVPVEADFRAWAAAADGQTVLELKAIYSFTNVGTVGLLPSPSGL
jgi:hypothetical protein